MQLLVLIYDIAANAACVAIATGRRMHILLNLLLQAMMMMIVVIGIIACVLVVCVRLVDALHSLLDMRLL